MEFDDRYLKLAGVTLAIALLIYLLIKIVFSLIGIDFPQFFHLTVSILGSGYLVSQYLAQHIA